MRRKLRRHLAFLMAVLMMLSLMGVQVLAEGVQVEAVQTTEGTDCTVLPEETDAEETSRSEMQKPDAKESPPESGVVTEEGKSTDSEKISVALKDEILTKGSLTADVSGTTESDQIAYQWQVSENGQWKDIEDTATVDSRKQSYEVARDGAQKTFRVKVTVNEAVTVYSSEYKVNYYDKLQNGSFETPKVSDAGTLTYKNAHFIQVANGTNDLYWKTTAKGAYFGSGTQRDYYIEIADGSRSYYGNTVNDPKPVYNISSAAQGNQFAELNCEEPGALYQDVLTEPGTVLHWGLEHAGRWGTDTMAVIISDTKSMSSDWNPAGSGFDQSNPDVQAVLSDKTGKWTYHYGDYTVPAGQYVTRFYFVAVAAANGNLSNGNLLDNISFGKDLPNPPAKTGNLIITKQVEGIAASQIPDKSFTFQIKRGEEVIEEVKLPQNGQWSASLQAVEPGEYTVTEIAQEQNNYRLEHTFYLVGQESQAEGMTARIDVTKEQTATVTYTNQYQPLMVVPTGVENRMFPTILSVSSKKEERKRFMKLKGEIHLFLIRLAFLLVFLWVLFGLLFGITTMKNNDMSPRISAGDLLFYYRLEKPKSGDVVVLQKAGEKYVGRVIAVGGDTVEITEDEKVKINGSKIVENDIFYDTPQYESDTVYPLTLNSGEYFILGDQRGNAKDSRYFGAVKDKEIKGRVITVLRRSDI